MTEPHGMGWNFETFQVYLDERDRRYQERFEAQELAVRIAIEAADKRLDGMNEFRATLSDQAVHFVPREELDFRITSLNEQIAKFMRNDVYKTQHDDLVRRVEKIQSDFANLIPINVYETQHTDLLSRVDKMETWRTAVSARFTVIAAAVAIGSGAIGAFVSHILK